MKRPAFQFYPADWRKDLELQSCSIGARGLWWELSCLMHEAEPYGHLTLRGVAMTDKQAAIAVRVELREYRKLLAELEAAGVPSRTADGILYSRRMVRDEMVRNNRAAGGALGAEHGVKGKEYGPMGGRPAKDKGGFHGHHKTGAHKPPSNPPPSSASSSSNNGVQNPSTDAGATPKPMGDRSPGKTKPDNGWQKSRDGQLAMGEYLGLPPKRGEVEAEYKARLFDALKAQESAH